MALEVKLQQGERRCIQVNHMWKASHDKLLRTPWVMTASNPFICSLNAFWLCISATVWPSTCVHGTHQR